MKRFIHILAFAICCFVGEMVIYYFSFLYDPFGIVSFGIIPTVLLYVCLKHFLNNKSEALIIIIALGIGLAYYGSFSLLLDFDETYAALLIPYLLNRLLFYYFISFTLYTKIENQRKAIITTIFLKLSILSVSAVLLSWLGFTIAYFILSSSLVGMYVELFGDDTSIVAMIFAIMISSLAPLLIVVFNYGSKKAPKLIKKLQEKYRTANENRILTEQPTTIVSTPEKYLESIQGIIGKVKNDVQLQENIDSSKLATFCDLKFVNESNNKFPSKKLFYCNKDIQVAFVYEKERLDRLEFYYHYQLCKVEQL